MLSYPFRITDRIRGHSTNLTTVVSSLLFRFVALGLARSPYCPGMTSTTTDLRSLITAYFDEVRLMQLATVREGQPWVCNVWFAYDDDMSLYWFSSVNRRHSEEVVDNQLVAGAVALPLSPTDVPRGVQFSGRAERLADDADIAKARSVYEHRIFPPAKVDEQMARVDHPHSFYRIRPTEFVLFDALNFPDNPRQQWLVESETVLA